MRGVGLKYQDEMTGIGVPVVKNSRFAWALNHAYQVIGARAGGVVAANTLGRFEYDGTHFMIFLRVFRQIKIKIG